jgi:hypothetical protein
MILVIAMISRLVLQLIGLETIATTNCHTATLSYLVAIPALSAEWSSMSDIRPDYCITDDSVTISRLGIFARNLLYHTDCIYERDVSICI